MQNPIATRVFEAIFISGFLLAGCFGQGAAAPPGNAGQSGQQPLPRLGIALSIGTLGAGIQVATAVERHLNVRGGFNYFSYSLSDTTNDNLAYNGSLRLESGEILLDYYPIGPFHVSGGALIYNGFQGSGKVSVPGGQTVTLNGVTYYSEASDPVTGNGKIQAKKYAPMVLFGFGNLLPRSQRHFSTNVDIGVAFQGSPNATLNLVGSTCATLSTGCAPISAQPTVQANVVAEQTKINKDLMPFRFYPVISMSFGYKF